jgi:exonuclease VII small subunit
VKLSRQCGTTLEAAEKRIEILVADREDSLEAAPFDLTDDSDETDFEDDDEFDEDE